MNFNRLSLTRPSRTLLLLVKDVIENDQVIYLSNELALPIECFTSHVYITDMYSGVIMLKGYELCTECRYVDNLLFDSSNYVLYTLPFCHDVLYSTPTMYYSATTTTTTPLVVFGLIYLNDNWLLYSYNSFIGTVSSLIGDDIFNLPKEIVPLLAKTQCHYFISSMKSDMYYLFSTTKSSKECLIDETLRDTYPKSHIHFADISFFYCGSDVEKKRTRGFVITTYSSNTNIISDYTPSRNPLVDTTNNIKRRLHS